MALNGCGQMCKWILILFNVLCGLAGLLTLGGGLYLRFSAEGPLNIDLKTNHFVFVVGLLMVVGALILLSAIVGCYGSCNENKTALGVYSGLLMFLTAAAIIAGIFASNNIHKFAEHTGEFYATVYAQYIIKRDWIRGAIIRLFHNTFDCCGLGGPLQTILKETDTCPQRYSVLGYSISTSFDCLTGMLNGMQAPAVLWFFLCIAGFMIVALVCCLVIWYQSSRSSVSAPPPYILLSSSPPCSSPPSFPDCAEDV